MLEEDPAKDTSEERLDDTAEVGHEFEDSVRNEKLAFISDEVSNWKCSRWKSKVMVLVVV